MNDLGRMTVTLIPLPRKAMQVSSALILEMP